MFETPYTNRLAPEDSLLARAGPGTYYFTANLEFVEPRRFRTPFFPAGEAYIGPPSTQ